ncbi:hypothetical protein GCM10009019_01340 [Salarchaeum japonicum]|uniref:Uncharacterized protein n=1 Tax=Salarchaeum japonicum TaxID=555573 RepID=A0AAV3SZH5_9EURY
MEWTRIGPVSFDVLSLVDSVGDPNTGAEKSHSYFDIEETHPYRLVQQNHLHAEGHLYRFV